MMCDFKRSMLREFDMTDLESMRFFFGIEVLQRTEGIFIYKKKICFGDSEEIWDAGKQ